MALRDEYPQVRKLAINNELMVQNKIIEHIQSWIYILKRMKKKTVKHKNYKDIRGYFL